MLTVLNIAYPFAAVGPDSVGGAEQMVAHLDRALVQAGHRSIVVARRDSRVSGELMPVEKEPGVIDNRARDRAWRRHANAIEAVLAERPVDLIHFHGLDFHAYLPRAAVPALVTLHLPPEWYEPAALRPDRPGLWFHCVSEAQDRALARSSAVLAPIPNGVSVAAFAAHRRRHGFALILGRVCPEKGVHLGLDAAREAGVPAIVAGQVFNYETHQRYFEREIRPRLGGRYRFAGPLGFDRKRCFLASARCLLLPSLAPETSSLAAMESLASGTPVVAFATGALPEIVEDGRTGFLVRDVREMAAAIPETATIDPDRCRAAARARFPLDRTLERYFDAYRFLAREAAGMSPVYHS